MSFKFEHHNPFHLSFQRHGRGEMKISTSIEHTLDIGNGQFQLWGILNRHFERIQNDHPYVYVPITNVKLTGGNVLILLENGKTPN